MPTFRIDVDDVVEDIFHELENVSDGGRAHACDIESHSKENAAEILTLRLMPFFKKKFKLHEM